MNTSRNPARSRPLSPNVKRLMRLARASPKNLNVIKFGREFSIHDLAYCNKQGMFFMEAASMGFSMEEFVPLYMTSQIAGIFDVYFSTSNISGEDKLFDLMQVPLLLKNPETIVEALYWIDEIIEHASDSDNKCLLVSRAYGAETLKLPPALAKLPDEPNRNEDELAYAYWLGYIYRCECLMHEESSRMVYAAFTEEIMREAYDWVLSSPIGQRDLADSAVEICNELDRLLVEKLWPEENKRRRKRQEKEIQRTPGASAPKAQEP